MTSQKLPAFLAASRSDVISLDVGHGLLLGSEDLVLLRQSSLQHFITSLEGRKKRTKEVELKNSVCVALHRGDSAQQERARK